MNTPQKQLTIAGRTFSSRLFVGTGKFGSLPTMKEAILASGSELVTVALKRLDHTSPADDLLKYIHAPHVHLLPNTSGARDAKEADFAASLLRGWEVRLQQGLLHSLKDKPPVSPCAGRPGLYVCP